MTCTDKVYHIYAKDRCLFHSLKKEEFEQIWSTLKNMVGLMKTDYSIDDLNFTEVISGAGGHSTDLSAEPPGSPSY
jgi:hypothetical protein